jgi:regulator of protease activity HflC (stomatin/prohibitin superfamily)
MKTEDTIEAQSGYLYLLLLLGLIIIAIISFATQSIFFGVVCIILLVLVGPGFIVVNPNESMVLILFGAYAGTIRESGFFWANPFYTKKKVSLRARNFISETIKVNDKVGNPVMIAMVLVWRVSDTFKAIFEVEAFEKFVVVQSESALRKLAGMFPYDNFEDENANITLRTSSDDINHKLEEEIKERLAIAGIEVVEARINHLAYASEIAGTMLKRQQACAVIAARSKIVEGAVGMVEAALLALSQKKIVELDEERKAAMVSNLMVVLCSEESARPVINAGSLYS